MYDYKWNNKKVYQAWIFSHESIVAAGFDVKIVTFPRARGRCCKNKTKATRPEAIDNADESVPQQSDLWKHDDHADTHVPFDVDEHRHTGSSHKEDRYWNGSNGHNMTKNLGYTYVQNQ